MVSPSKQPFANPLRPNWREEEEEDGLEEWRSRHGDLFRTPVRGQASTQASAPPRLALGIEGDCRGGHPIDLEEEEEPDSGIVSSDALERAMDRVARMHPRLSPMVDHHRNRSPSVEVLGGEEDEEEERGDLEVDMGLADSYAEVVASSNARTQRTERARPPPMAEQRTFSLPRYGTDPCPPYRCLLL